VALTGIYFLGLPLIVIITLLQFLEGLIDGHSRASSSGRVGLLGFSLGGYVAAAPATRDERVAALGVLYGGMPDTMVSEVKHLPPLIELHGTADRNVPPAKGEELVKLGKAIPADTTVSTFPIPIQ
jgi:carboxymethylenebutenolidase